MLNTDVELFYDLTLDSVDLLATCSPFQDCGLAPTYDYASNFAEVCKSHLAVASRKNSI